jgi:hypothetical protein
LGEPGIEGLGELCGGAVLDRPQRADDVAVAGQLERGGGVDRLVVEPLRAEIDTAPSAHTAAARTGGWAILYLLAGVLWWPAAVAALILGVTSMVRGRLTVTAFAELIEAAADCHLRDLATRLGLPGTGPLTVADGETMTALLGKQRR